MPEDTDITTGTPRGPADDEPTGSLGSGLPVSEPGPMPTRVGRYAITRVLGEGGMGTVYEAQQESPSRTVALKVVRAGYLSQDMLRRFVLESQVLGRLQHPGIAQVYEAGMAEDERGQAVPFFAMEHIRGVPLNQYADANTLGTRQRLELVAKICDAVYHAHQKGVIHRDLKPGNILVDETGQPKILDFGVARATDSDLQTTTLQTDIGQLIGTVPYMSPEQVSGDPGDLDTRSDVYALGVIAYELLAGRLPYSLKDRMIHEAVRAIREEEPTRLSSISRTLRGDVETIVAKALEKDKTRRYQSAESLGSDIRRYLTDEPIEARPASTWYQIQKFSRRNRGLVAGVAAAFVLLIAGLAGTSFGLVEANRQRIAAERSAEREADQRQAAEDARAEAETARVEAEAARAEEAKRAEELELVADFQAEQLSAIEPDTMGVRLRQSLLDAVPEDQRETLGATLSPVNFTNIALTTLEDNIFRQTIAAIDSQFEGQPLVRAQLLTTVADTLGALGMLDLATAPQERALAIRRAELGDEHPSTLSSINNMGGLLHNQGKLDEAEAYYRESLDANRRLLGNEHPDTLSCINNMGGLLHDQGKLDKAEAYYREALEGDRRLRGNEHTDTLTSISNMGTVLHDQGKLDEAEPYYREALEGRRRVLGDDHPDTLISISNMAVLLHTQGKLDEAEPYYREALEGRRRVLGDEHPDTLGSVNNLGVLLRQQGRLAEAEPYMREAVEGSRLVLGDLHPDTLSLMHNMAVLLHTQGKLDEAETYYRNALGSCRRVLGDEHPDTLSMMNSMGALLRSQGKLTEAEPYYREALEGRRRVLGDEHPSTLTSINNMGLLLQAQGKLTEAEPYYREALEGRRRVLGDEHPRTLVSIYHSVEHLLVLERFAEAERLALECERLNRKVFGAAHSETADAINLLIDLYAAWHEAEPDAGRDAEAERWWAKLPSGEDEGDE